MDTPGQPFMVSYGHMTALDIQNCSAKEHGFYATIVGFPMVYKWGGWGKEKEEEKKKADPV